MGAELAVISNNADNVEAYRASTNAAEICKGIVLASSSTIQGKRYVSVEGWMAIARAHGCAAGAADVERVEGGFRATGEVRDMATGTLIARAEGFVGEDEPTWFGGQSRGKTLPKRADYAIRAMAQTRAISRACRSAFAHVVVMMNAGLATTPAEEVPFEGFDNGGERHDPETGEVVETKIAGIHKIKQRLRALQTEADKADTLEAFNALVSASSADLSAIRDAHHGWWTGDGEDFEGFRSWIKRRREELAEPAEGGMYAMLIKSMKECQTLVQLANWMATNETLIGELDGAESRRFQLAYELHESGIKAMDQVSA